MKSKPAGQRKVVYVLGAGFSYGTGHFAQYGKKRLEMPLQNNLLKIIFEYHHRSINNLDSLARDIRRYFNPKQYRSKRKKGADRHSDIEDLSVEEIVTFLEEMARETSGNEAIRFRDNERQLRQLTIGLISYLSGSNKPANNQVLRKFRKELLKNTDTIITFNWDTLLDRILEKGKKWHRAWGYGNTIKKLFCYQQSKALRPLKSHITLLKLHGSINWLAFEREFNIAKDYVPTEPRHGDVVMMPPKMRKDEIYGDEPSEPRPSPDRGNWAVHPDKLYPTIWKEAENHLIKAKKIVFIGYSFPPADYAVSSMLRRAFAEIKVTTGKTPIVEIVDPNVNALADNFERSFKIKIESSRRFLSLQSYVNPRRRT